MRAHRHAQRALVARVVDARPFGMPRVRQPGCRGHAAEGPPPPPVSSIVALVRRHNPRAHIVFTLSPVPLNATFRGVSCVTANAVSKSILRVAVDELLREEGHGIISALPAPPAAAAAPPAAAGGEAAIAVEGGGGGAAGRLFYWPAYEMIKEAFVEPYLDDGRHVKPAVVQQVLALFGKHYCRNLVAAASSFLLAAEQRARDCLAH